MAKTDWRGGYCLRVSGKTMEPAGVFMPKKEGKK